METKQKECEICGVWFTPSRSSQKYCPECGKDSTKAWRDLHKHMQYSVARVGTGRPVSKTEVECKYCHKTFTCYNGVTSAYCSKACEAADRIQNTFCACCGKPMLETDDQRDTGWHNWYCSAECEALHKDKEPHAYKNCVICHKTFFCPASEMMAPLCSDSCRQEYNRKQEQNKKKAKQIKMVSAAELKAKKKAAAEKKYIAENGLCSICRTSYKDCERMQSNYTASPKGAVFSGSLVIKCPKYTAKKPVHRPA